MKFKSLLYLETKDINFIAIEKYEDGSIILKVQLEKGMVEQELVLKE